MSCEPTINRAKTALSRNNFPRPVQHLLESGLLTKKRLLRSAPKDGVKEFWLQA